MPRQPGRTISRDPTLMTLPRFYPILDTSSLARAGLSLTAAADALLDAGAPLIQIRHKQAFTRSLCDEVATIAATARAVKRTLIVNDRADIAALVGAGLHLGQDDLYPRDARRILGEVSPIGYSTHNEAQLRAAASEPIDYIALGPIFGTTSKERPDPVVGLDNLRRWRTLTSLSLVAIGGITLSTAHGVWAAGADSVAVIHDLLLDGVTPQALRRRAHQWLDL